MSPRIDAHQHFWRYRGEDYPWISTGMDVLRRDWLPEDLRPLLDQQGIDACIAVQARADEAENDFLLALADAHPWIAAVVGWIDLSANDAEDRVALRKQHPRFAGVRHLLQDENDIVSTLADPRFEHGMRQLQRQGLVYEVLVRGAAQLAAATTFCARHDRHWLVLDHLGKPAIGGGEDEAWRDALSELAAMPHVLCKASGLVTEAVGAGVDDALLRRYLDTALDLFGPRRLLFGSDWPVCLPRAAYPEVCGIIEDWSRPLGPDEQALLWGGNAARCYGLPRAMQALEHVPCN